MGWAARANPVAQAAKRREIAPKVRTDREPSVREKAFMKHWNAMLARIGAVENAILERTPKHLQSAVRELRER